MSIYKFAAQKRLRFPSMRGELTVEQLFSLPLKTDSGDSFDLDTVARTINDQLKAQSTESFVEVSRTSPLVKKLETALEIVKDVIKTKQEEAEAAKTRATNEARRQKILGILAQKDDAALVAASREDLEKELAAL